MIPRWSKRLPNYIWLISRHCHQCTDKSVPYLIIAPVVWVAASQQTQEWNTPLSSCRGIHVTICSFHSNNFDAFDSNQDGTTEYFVSLNAHSGFRSIQTILTIMNKVKELDNRSIVPWGSSPWLDCHQRACVSALLYLTDLPSTKTTINRYIFLACSEGVTNPLK